MTVSEPVRTALILAAGIGRRLGARGAPQPKGFLEIDGTPIIARSLACLAAAGIRHALVVTGHHGARYDELAAPPGLAVDTVSNPHYADSGSLYSWQCAADRVAGLPYLLLESDLVYETRALETLLADPAESLVLLSGPTGAGDEVWVEVEGMDDHPRLVAMAKDRTVLGPGVAGEFVGICKIGPALHDALAAFATGRLARTRHADYETRALETLLADPAESLVLLSGPTGAGDEVWVEVEGTDDHPRLVAMAKDRTVLGPGVAGEFVGICKIGPALHDALAAFATGRLARTRHADYETDGLVAAASVLPVPCRRVDDLLWGEIDDEAHLARVVGEVWPRLD